MVGRLAWKLRIPDGSLAIEGGLDPETRDDDDHVRYIDVPPEGEALENPGIVPDFYLGVDAHGGGLLLSLRPRENCFSL